MIKNETFEVIEKEFKILDKLSIVDAFLKKYCSSHTDYSIDEISHTNINASVNGKNIKLRVEHVISDMKLEQRYYIIYKEKIKDADSSFKSKKEFCISISLNDFLAIIYFCILTNSFKDAVPYTVSKIRTVITSENIGKITFDRCSFIKTPTAFIKKLCSSERNTSQDGLISMCIKPEAIYEIEQLFESGYKYTESVPDYYEVESLDDDISVEILMTQIKNMLSEYPEFENASLSTISIKGMINTYKEASKDMVKKVINKLKI